MSVFLERRCKAEDPRSGTPRKNARLLDARDSNIRPYGTERSKENAAALVRQYHKGSS